MVDVVQSPQKERESNSNMQWEMTDQGQEGDGKKEKFSNYYQMLCNKKKGERVTQICSGNDGSRSRG